MQGGLQVPATYPRRSSANPRSPSSQSLNHTHIAETGSCQKTFGKTNKTKQQNPYPRVSLKPLKTVLVWLFLMFVLAFFGFLWYCWFSRRIFWFCKNLRENQTTKKTKPISKGESETLLNTLFFWLFLIFVWFSLVFFGIFGFLEGFFGFVKTFGKTNKTKNNKPISKGGSETFKNIVFFCFS